MYLESNLSVCQMHQCKYRKTPRDQKKSEIHTWVSTGPQNSSNAWSPSLHRHKKENRNKELNTNISITWCIFRSTTMVRFYLCVKRYSTPSLHRHISMRILPVALDVISSYCRLVSISVTSPTFQATRVSKLSPAGERHKNMT